MIAAKRKRDFAAVAADICRVILGAAFVFSGLTKLIDPYGTALKTAEYLGAMGLGFAEPLATTLAVVQIALETSLGIIILTRMFRRAASLCLLVLMAGFTALTLWLAVANPIDDCGCFGDVVVLSNWQTFYKNLVLLALSIVTWLANRRGRLFAATRREWIISVDTVALVALLTLLNLLFLPVIDRSALRVGTDLRASTLNSTTTDAQVVYRNRSTGEVRSFSLDDSTWWNDAEWEYVDTVIADDGDGVRVTAADFQLYASDANATAEIVGRDGTTALICIQNPARLSAAGLRKLSSAAAASAARGARVIVATATELPDGFALCDDCAEYYLMDITVMQVLLRADAGVVTLRDGMIVDKRSLFEMK